MKIDEKKRKKQKIAGVCRGTLSFFDKAMNVLQEMLQNIRLSYS